MSLSTQSPIDELHRHYGALYGCQLSFSAFEIQEEDGSLVLGGDRYSAYVMCYGTSFGAHHYCMLNDNSAIAHAVEQGDLCNAHLEICREPDDPEWSPAHVRLVNRLRRSTWSSFAGGEEQLPPVDAPMDHYPGDGDILIPEAGVGPKGRNDEERLYMQDPRAWFRETGFPDLAPGYNFPSDHSEFQYTACFIVALDNGRPWSAHDGPTEKIAHLFKDPTKDQYLGRLDDALKIFDDMAWGGAMTRCVMTRNRAQRIHLELSGGRTLTFDRSDLIASGTEKANTPNTDVYQITLDGETEPSRVTYEELVAAIEKWPLPSA